MNTQSPPNTKAYDRFKAVVTALLVLIIAILLVRLNRTPSVATPASTVAPTVAAVAAPTLVLPEKPEADGSFRFRGSGTPGSTVELWADGQRLQAVTVGADGQWELTADLPAGKHALVARAVDASGKVLAESAPATFDAPVPITAPTLILPEKPEADGRFRFRGSGTPGSTVELWADGQRLQAVTVGADGQWELTADLPAGKHALVARAADASGKVLAESAPATFDAPAPLTAPTLILPETLEAGKPVVLKGAGEPGATVEIIENGEVIGQAEVGADGTWTFSYTPAAGQHTLVVQPAGDPTHASAPQTLTMPAPPAVQEPPAAPPTPSATCGIGEDRGTTYVVARCEYMGLIAKRVGVSLAALIAANPQVTNPNLIYPGQVLNLPAR